MTNAAATAIVVLIAAACLALVAWLSYRVLRWARAGRTSARAMGEVLTEVTQSAVVREAKQRRKRSGQGTGDPPGEE